MADVIKITYTADEELQTVLIAQRLASDLLITTHCAMDVQKYLDKTSRVYWGQQYRSINMTLLPGPESLEIFEELKALRVELKLYYKLLWDAAAYITCKVIPEYATPYWGGGLAHSDLVLGFLEITAAPV